MDLKELHSFKISDAVTFHDNLNPKLFRGQNLQPQVELQLKTIAQDFLQEMGIHDLDVRDITISGSNAAYSYTDHSDLDLHILVNMKDLPDDDIYHEFFKAKKDLYNDSHDITINGIPVELYIQDASEPVTSLGEYSIKDKKWLRLPTKRRANFDQTATKSKYIKLLDIIDTALQSNKIGKVNKVLKKIKQYRQAGLDKGGEFSPENLAYKALRSRGYITKLYDLRDRLHSKHLSLDNMYANVDEDYDPNGIPPGPEFKPTMPAGTVKVDVSDTYDWYKLGQHISNLDGLGKHDFGQGPPSTIMAFGSEEAEHKYIDALKKTGLTTTDIDPLDPNQPKGMKRQKTDPTYNVNEAVTDNYLYHATMPAGMMRILRTGIIKATDRPQPSTKSKTQYPTISTTRSKQYAESNDFVDFLNLTNDGNSVILVFDRNTVANHYKMFSTSQGTQTVGDEYEEVIVAPKGSMPIKGTLKGFYFNPRRTEEIEGYKDIPWFNELLTSPYYIGPKQGVAEGTTVTRIDSNPITDFGSSLKAYKHTDDWSQSGVDTGDDSYWKNKNLKTNTTKGLFAGDPKRTALYATGNAHETRYVEFTQNGQPIVYFDRKDLPAMRSRKTYLTVFDASDFRQLPTGEWFSENPSKPIKQVPIGDPFKYIADQGWIVRVTDNLDKVFKQVQNMHKAGKIAQYGAEGMNESKQGVAEASGYIPSEKQKNDPRFSTALTVDVKPDSIKKNAKAFYWNTSRAGIPPTAKPSGKI